MAKLNLKNGYTANSDKVSKEALPASLPFRDDYKEFWEVRVNTVLFWLARGNEQAPGQIVLWYPNEKFWAFYGNTLTETVSDAMGDAWKYI